MSFTRRSKWMQYCAGRADHNAAIVMASAELLRNGIGSCDRLSWIHCRDSQPPELARCWRKFNTPQMGYNIRELLCLWNKRSKLLRLLLLTVSREYENGWHILASMHGSPSPAARRCGDRVRQDHGRSRTRGVRWSSRKLSAPWRCSPRLWWRPVSTRGHRGAITRT